MFAEPVTASCVLLDSARGTVPVPTKSAPSMLLCGRLTSAVPEPFSARTVLAPPPASVPEPTASATVSVRKILEGANTLT